MSRAAVGVLIICASALYAAPGSTTPVPQGDPYTAAAWPTVGMSPRNSREGCIGWHENRDRYDRSANGSHFGRWQLSRQLWETYAPHLETWFPGISGRWGWAGPAQQDAVFAVVVAQDGYWPWNGDGC